MTIIPRLGNRKNFPYVDRAKGFFKFKNFHKANKDIVINENYLEVQSGSLNKMIREKAKVLWGENKQIHSCYNNNFDEFYEYCRKKIVEDKDPLASIQFYKPVSKQGLDEKDQASVIASTLLELEILHTKYNRTDIKNIEKPTNLYLVDGKEVVCSKRPETEENVKSIDLIVRYCFKDKIFKGLCTLKYATVNGGGQNNQLTDVKNSNKAFKRVLDDNVYTFSIVDGSYFDVNKRKPLYTKYGDKKNKIVSSSTFPVSLIDSIIHWLINTGARNDSEIKDEIARLILIRKDIKTKLSR